MLSIFRAIQFLVSLFPFDLQTHNDAHPRYVRNNHNNQPVLAHRHNNRNGLHSKPRHFVPKCFVSCNSQTVRQNFSHHCHMRGYRAEYQSRFGISNRASRGSRPSNFRGTQEVVGHEAALGGPLRRGRRSIDSAPFQCGR